MRVASDQRSVIQVKPLSDKCSNVGLYYLALKNGLNNAFISHIFGQILNVKNSQYKATRVHIDDGKFYAT